MGVLFAVLVLVMAFATFVEKDYGANVARYFIYNTWWFELIFVLAVINILGQIVFQKLYKLKKNTIFLFHFAFVLIIIGAGITRYFGIEGMMHIREGESVSRFVLVDNSKLDNRNTKDEYIDLPFSLKLDKFSIERYPGSNSPSSFVSNIVLVDIENGIEMPYLIYMNHILKYRGYRFFQSSYDKDEKGTILSVSKDPYGLFVTYMGYFILILNLILSLINKHSLFRSITINQLSSVGRKMAGVVLILLLITTASFADNEKLIVPTNQANYFGSILVQDQTGRTEPLYTLSHDILRKVSKKTSIDGLNPMQVFLGFYFDFDHWKEVPLIKVSNKEIRKIIGIKGDYASFTDFIDLEKESYKLSYTLHMANSKPANARNKLDKEIIKLDERVNICYMMYTGDFLKLFPVIDSSDVWHSPADAYLFTDSKDDSLYLSNIISLVYNEIVNKNPGGEHKYLSSIKLYQQKYAKYKLPSELKIKSEILYYKSGVFERLFPFYGTMGFVLFILLVSEIIRRRKIISGFIVLIKGFLLIAFILHTSGFFLRWYISGHAPMSNGYETMIFISWVTILAGFIFQHRSPMVLAATSMLASLTLLVAHLSFMDPEITNLVPVLKSYWLTLHVSVITSSYGFLGLAAVLGILIMILYLFISEKNKLRINKTIEELTIINYKAVTIGLYLLTIGTFLGAIWANESWGRYWGWDPKETWSLITIIVYSFVLHSRMIEIFRSIFVFNLMSLVAFSSVLMTYFGVNYFLSGLHSYAGGSSTEIPGFVYFIITFLLMLSFMAFIKYKKVN
ncbi:MAG: c-type cytochrome biogenesis protein CcsB [Bacteroidetes bacterium GWF2_33_16]|nr:MAG: c-type cytochrome biogenesis protein CcsB [Bacteroidetes bacterium GWE2_32_14]OFY06745.1 MAG: c-type cytochrome biogenesis protein CcsB [Bacteroidetes bacterium GWF2_33_16]